MFTGAQYLVFREYVHARYAANNGAFLWCLAETLYECFCVVLYLFLALASIMTEFKHERTQATYLRLVLYSASTLAYWTPIAFFYFYLFSPSNYHIGRIIMKNTYHHAERSRIRKGQKSRHGRARGQEEEEPESYVDDKVYAEAAASQAKEERVKPTRQPATSGASPVASPVTSPPQQQVPPVPPSQPLAPKYVQQAYYAPAHEQPTSRQFAFGLPSPVTYVNEQQQPLQAQPVVPVFQTKDQADKNLTMHTYGSDYELVSQYQTLRNKIQKSQMHIQPRQPFELAREERSLSPKTLKKFGKLCWPELFCSFSNVVNH